MALFTDVTPTPKPEKDPPEENQAFLHVNMAAAGKMHRRMKGGLERPLKGEKRLKSGTLSIACLIRTYLGIPASYAVQCGRNELEYAILIVA
jgi:hypothetical protein